MSRSATRDPRAGCRGSSHQPGSGRKKGLFRDLRAEVAAEVERLSYLAASQLSDPAGGGLQAVELAIRTAMLWLGGSLLEDLLAVDGGHRGARVECGHGHRAEFVGDRPKQLDTVLGPVRLGRAYYYCAACHRGLAPKDEELGISGSSLSPGLRRMVARVGSQEPFAHARRDLAELAGLEARRDLPAADVGQALPAANLG